MDMSQTNYDRKMLEEMPKKKLIDLFFYHIHNLWRVDGLYFLGIEEKFDTKAATEIDTNCWKLMGKLEARELKNLLETKEKNIPNLMHVLKHTSWSLDQRDKKIVVSDKRGVYRVTKCRTQETRIKKGLREFPCRNVRFTYLKSFTEEFNPRIKVSCRVCPPAKHPPSVWCEWEFQPRKKEN